MPPELTERHLNIPHTIAVKYARPDTYEYDELVSDLNLALVEAARCYRDGCGREFSSWLIYCTKCRIAKIMCSRKPYTYNHRGRPCTVVLHEARWRALSSLDAPVSEGSRRTVGQMIASTESERPGTDFEIAELVEKALSKLSPNDRAMFVMRYRDGMRFHQIGAAFGYSDQWAIAHLKRIRKFLRRSASRIGCRRGKNNLKPIPPPRTENQRKAAADFCRERAVADRLLGKIPRGKWLMYGCNDTDKLLVGPLRPPRGAARYADAPTRQDVQSRGMRLVRGPEARRMAEYEGYRLGDLHREERGTDQGGTGASRLVDG